MSKLGISVRIDVTKIDKTRLFKGEKGTYLDLTTFIDTENKDQYENNGFIAESVSKDERQAGVQGTILGNCRVFYKGDGASSQAQAAKGTQQAREAMAPNNNFEDQDIPF